MVIIKKHKAELNYIAEARYVDGNAQLIINKHANFNIDL